MKQPGVRERMEALRGQLARRSRRGLGRWAQGLQPSAVLLPLVIPPGTDETDPAFQPELLFIVRTSRLVNHSGQIAFPGGKREPADPSLEHTALRETSEEIGLPPERVEVVGLLDDVATLNLFAITPVVGVVSGELTVVPSEDEVADTFRAPLDQLVATYHHGGFREWVGVSYAMHEFHVPDRGGIRLIWGATARMTYQLLELLGLMPPAPDRP